MWRLRHESNECSFPPISGNSAGYGEWTRTKMVRDMPYIERPVVVSYGQRRCAGERREIRTTGSMAGGVNTRNREGGEAGSLTQGQGRGRESHSDGSRSLGNQGIEAGPNQAL